MFLAIKPFGLSKRENKIKSHSLKNAIERPLGYIFKFGFLKQRGSEN